MTDVQILGAVFVAGAVVFWIAIVGWSSLVSDRRVRNMPVADAGWIELDRAVPVWSRPKVYDWEDEPWEDAMAPGFRRFNERLYDWAERGDFG